MPSTRGRRSKQAALQGLGDPVLAQVGLLQLGLHRLALVDVDGRPHVTGELAPS